MMRVGDIMKPMAPVLETGTYAAVCVGVAAIGEQYVDYSKFGKDENGKTRKPKYEYHMVFIWDIPSKLDDDGKPKQLSKEINVAFSSTSNLNKILSAWNSRTYTSAECRDANLEEQIGKACILTVEATESGFSNVKAVSAIPDGMTAPTTNTPPIIFSVFEWNDDVFKTLPDWLQNKIKQSTQYQKAHPPTNTIDFPNPADFKPAVPVSVDASDFHDEDVPF